MRPIVRALIVLSLAAIVALGSSVSAQTLARLPAPIEISTTGDFTNGNSITNNATGEYAGIVGRIWLAGGTGSKTCSSGGGCQFGWTVGSLTFANAGSSLQIGLQDVDTATGFADGTFDVSVTLVPGTDTATANTVNLHTADAGTKTLTHGDLVALKMEWIVRAGSDATVVTTVSRQAFPFAFPYGVYNDGSGDQRNSNPIATFIVFDDGSLGWFDGVPILRNFIVGRTTISVNSGSTPDEYAAIIQVPVSLSINGFGMWLNGIASTDDFEYVLYADPLGTPSVVATYALDPAVNSQDGVILRYGSTIDLAAATPYGLAWRPTTTNAITFEHFTLPSTGSAPYMKQMQFFPTIQLAARTDQTGAFSETNAVHLPMLALSVTRLIGEDYSTPPAPDTVPVPAILSLRTR